jgi:hypothetical protein
VPRREREQVTSAMVVVSSNSSAIRPVRAPVLQYMPIFKEIL